MRRRSPNKDRYNTDRWFDEVSPVQYSFPASARIRRAPLEHITEETLPTDYHQYAYEVMGLRKNARILNIGSGDGLDEVRWTTEFNHTGDIVGVEVGARSISFDERFLLATDLLKKAGKCNVQFIEGNALMLPFHKHTKFDAVTMWNVSYHVPDIRRALEEVLRVLHAYGKFEHLTNGENNKPLQHDVIRKIKQRLGVQEHHPLSAVFNLQNSHPIISEYFTPIEPILQRGEYIINEKTLPEFIFSVDSYRSTIPYRFQREWVAAREEVIKQEILSKLREKRDKGEKVEIRDGIERGGWLYENSKNLNRIQRAMGARAVRLFQL